MATTTVKVRQYHVDRLIGGSSTFVREASFIYTPKIPTTTFGFRGVCFNGTDLVFSTTRSLANIAEALLVFVSPDTLIPRAQLPLSISATFLDAMDVCWMGGSRYGVLTGENGGGGPSLRRDLYIVDAASGYAQRMATAVVSTTGRSIDWTGQDFLISDVGGGLGEQLNLVAVTGQRTRLWALASAGFAGPGIALVRDRQMRAGERMLTKADPGLFATRQWFFYTRGSGAPVLTRLPTGPADNATEQGPIAMAPSSFWEFDSSN